MPINARHRALLDARGLDIGLLEKLGVESSERLGVDSIMIPYYRGEQVVGRKYRTLAGEKRFAQDLGSEQIFYNLNCLFDPYLQEQPVIVTEGEADCWAALQCGFDRVVSVPAGAPATEVGDRASTKYAFVDEILPLLPEETIFILAVDSDEPGSALRKDLANRLKARRCKWVKYPKGCKDLNDALLDYGQKGVVQSIERAQWMVGNVFKMADIPPVPEKVAYASGFPGLDDHYRLRLGDLCVVTGVPAAGKSSFVGDLACRMAMRHRWPVCFASFEQEPTTDHRRMLRTFFSGRLVVSMTPEEIDKADRWINESFVFITQSDEEPATLAWIMERMAFAAKRFGSRLFVIDPWNEVEHDRPDGMSLTEYIGWALRELRQFCRQYEAHVIVVAHPAKIHRNRDGEYPTPTLYDISDSAMWANRPDVGIVIARMGKEDGKSLVRVCKSKYEDQIGTTGDVYVRWNFERGTYEEIPERIPAGIP